MAQLSLTGRATLRVVKNFAKSIKLMRNYTVGYGVCILCKFLLIFIVTTSLSCTVSEILNVK